MSEHIKHEPHDKDAWVCICGNTSSELGFYPIDDNNREVEPTERDWTTNQYVCDQCGRVIDKDTLEVVRKLDLTTVVRRV
jgi:YD repeat-containing protein